MLRGQVRGAMRSVWAYRFDVITATIGLVLQVWLLSVVWRAVYAGAAEVCGITAAQAVSYAVLAACVQQALMPWQFSSLLTRVRSGQVGIDLTRPRGQRGQELPGLRGRGLADEFQVSAQLLRRAKGFQPPVGQVDFALHMGAFRGGEPQLVVPHGQVQQLGR